MDLQSPPKRVLWHLLKGFLRLSYARLQWELRQRGHNVSERRLSLMLRGLKPMSAEIEKALDRIGAEGINEGILDPEGVGEVIEPWCGDDELDGEEYS